MVKVGLTYSIINTYGDNKKKAHGIKIMNCLSVCAKKKTRENQNNAQNLYHDVLKYVKHK